MDKINNYPEQIISKAKWLGVLEYKLSLSKDLSKLNLPPDVHLDLIKLIEKDTELSTLIYKQNYE